MLSVSGSIFIDMTRFKYGVPPEVPNKQLTMNELMDRIRHAMVKAAEYNKAIDKLHDTLHCLRKEKE
jgi:hypothetical protein